MLNSIQPGSTTLIASLWCYFCNQLRSTIQVIQECNMFSPYQMDTLYACQRNLCLKWQNLPYKQHVEYTPSIVWYLLERKRKFICYLEPLYTRVWGSLARDIQIMWLVKKPGTIQVCFTLNHEGLRDHIILNGWKSTCCPTWHQVDIVSWYTLTSVMSPYVMPLPLLYSNTLGNGCAQCKSLSLLSHFPPIYHRYWH